MALDIYVGPLARYFAGDWETVAMKQARDIGVRHETVRPSTGALNEAVRDLGVLQTAVSRWRQLLNTGLKPHGYKVDWDESPSAPYFTDRPGWNGYHALLLLAAHDEHPAFAVPDAIPSNWDDDPAFKASTAANFVSNYAQVVGGVELWLPCDINLIFKAPSIEGSEPIWIGSAVLLASQLRLLDDRLRSRPASSEFHAAARFALQLFLKLSAASVENRLPMKLDY
jgi:hypothetical protein